MIRRPIFVTRATILIQNTEDLKTQSKEASPQMIFGEINEAAINMNQVFFSSKTSLVGIIMLFVIQSVL